MLAAVDAPTAKEVANILLYVAPGFFARVGYVSYFPRKRSEQFYVVIFSVAASVPLVALTSALAQQVGLERDPAQAKYALLLVAVGLLAGYILARLRDTGLVRAALALFGLPFQPEATIYEQTVMRLPEAGEVTVQLDDGRVISGYPAIGPSSDEPDLPRELYLTWPRWWEADQQEWVDAGGGIILDLSKAIFVSLAEDPRGRPRGFSLKQWRSDREDSTEEGAASPRPGDGHG